MLFPYMTFQFIGMGYIKVIVRTRKCEKCTKGNNSNIIETRVMNLVYDTSSHYALSAYVIVRTRKCDVTNGQTDRQTALTKTICLPRMNIGGDIIKN